MLPNRSRIGHVSDAFKRCERNPGYTRFKRTFGSTDGRWTRLIGIYIYTLIKEYVFSP